MMRLLAILLITATAYGQNMGGKGVAGGKAKFGGMGNAPPAAIALDGSAHCANAVAGAATVSCTLTGVTAGDLITVEVANRGDGAPVDVTDDLSETFTQIFYVQDSSNPAWGGMYYFQSSAGGTTTVTFALNAGDTWLEISAEAWKVPGATHGALDTGFSPYNQVSLTGTVANSNCGTAVTPATAGELVIGLHVGDNVAPTAGTNYTLIDAGGSMFPEYWIQTTATATNAPFVNAADDWISGCAAFKP